MNSICLGCGLNLPSDSFYKANNKSNNNLFRHCKACSSQRSRSRFSRLKRLNLCATCGVAVRRKTSNQCEGCWKRKSARMKTWRIDIMRQVIQRYGNKCACCGEERFEFLTIDHINNDGYIERKRKFGGRSKGGYRFYVQLLKLDYIREDLQVLCYNCNCGKARCGGTCPHKLVEQNHAEVA